jgi:hypothetical protein
MGGFALGRNEAVVMMICMPPEAKYFGITAYVSSRLLINDTVMGTGDGKLLPMQPMVEIKGERQMEVNGQEGEWSG